MNEANYHMDPVLEVAYVNGFLDDAACDEIIDEKNRTSKSVRDIIVDGGRVKGGIASTVVRITDTSIKYYRIGSISEADIAACIGH